MNSQTLSLILLAATVLAGCGDSPAPQAAAAVAAPAFRARMAVDPRAQCDAYMGYERNDCLAKARTVGYDIGTPQGPPARTAVVAALSPVAIADQ